MRNISITGTCLGEYIYLQIMLLQYSCTFNIFNRMNWTKLVEHFKTLDVLMEVNGGIGFSKF